MKKLLFVCLSSLMLLVVVLITRTLMISAESAGSQASRASFDEQPIAEHLTAAIRIKTISYEDKSIDEVAFRNFHDFLERTYPAIHSGLDKHIINKYSLIYHWQGSDPSLKPVLFLAHFDVVPAVDQDNRLWQYPPFSGTKADGFLWGRGTLDDKGSLIVLMEAIEGLIRQGHQPRRSIYLAFGHDEEMGGGAGAQQIAKWMHTKNLKFEYILDEGSFIADGLIPFVDNPVALIGPAEKGFLTLRLSVHTESGHASMPPRHTAIGLVSRAVSRIEQNPMALHFEFSNQLFETVRPYMSFLAKLVFTNDWLFSPLLVRAQEADPISNASIRTTAAATMIQGGIKANILPDYAEAKVNFRILPGDNIESVIKHVSQVVDDERIKIEQFAEASNPSNITSTESPAYQLLANTIREASNSSELVVAPRIVVAATDSRHYQSLSEQILRFACFTLDKDNISGIHGFNERVAISDLGQAVRFYTLLIKNSDKL